MHTYEGCFSTEGNMLLIFSMHFHGVTFSKELAQVFNPEMGIIMQVNWSDVQVHKDQWYIKFWVLILLLLF